MSLYISLFGAMTAWHAMAY